MPRYKQIREQSTRFVFKYDDDAPDLLHIYARHPTSVDDALDVFFNPSSTQNYNPEHQRYERYDGRHGLFWFWLVEPSVVMVITCFKEDQHGEAP